MADEFVYPTLILVHGFNDKSAGEKNIDKSRPFFEAMGYTVDTDTTDYNWLGLLRVKFKRRKNILRIARAVDETKGPIVIITYSNGAHFTMKALKYIFKKDLIIIHCSAALNRKIKFPVNVREVLVFHIKSDTTVWWASFIPFSKWGRMGAVGYKGNDPRVMNIDYSDIAAKHGGMWADEVLPYFTKHVDALLRGNQ